MWGFMPYYFHLLQDVRPDLFLAQRVLWTIPVGLGLVVAGRMSRNVLAAFRDGRTILFLFACSFLIGVNWLVNVWAVQNDRILEAAVGFYLNPIVNLALGAAIFGERFSRLQMGAAALSVAGVVNQALGVGAFPWVALLLCGTFAAYGALRKAIDVDARSGLLIEVLLLSPFAIGWIGYEMSHGVDVTASSSSVSALIMMSGAILSTPLILFAMAARRLNLSTLGMIQYLAPTMHVFVGVSLGEHFTPAHTVTFILIWSGVALFSYGSWRGRQARRAVSA